MEQGEHKSKRDEGMGKGEHGEARLSDEEQGVQGETRGKRSKWSNVEHGARESKSSRDEQEGERWRKGCKGVKVAM